MSNYIYYFALSLITQLVVFVAFYNKNILKILSKKLLLKFIISTVVVPILLSLPPVLGVGVFDNRFPATTVIIISVVSILICLAKNSLIKTFSKAALIIFLLELTILNFSAYNSWITPLETENAHLQKAFISQNNDDLEVPQQGKTRILIKNNELTTIEFINLNVKTKFISLKTGNLSKGVKLTVNIKDNNLSNTYYKAYESSFYPTDKQPFSFPVNSADEITHISFQLEGAANLTINQITFNPKIPLKFNLLRFFIIIAFSFFIILVKQKKLYLINLNLNKKKHVAAITLAVVFCLLICSCINIIFVKGNNFIDYPLKNDVESYSPYIQQFDAFQKGQLNLDIAPTTSINLTSNPYDVTTRPSDQWRYWDRSYYDGKLYSYYGTAPLFVLYYPFYILTGKLPHTSFSCCFFTVLICFALMFTILTFARWYCKKINLLLLLLGSLSVMFTGCIFLITVIGDFYCIPILSAILFLLLFLSFSLLAYKTSKLKFFFLSGMSFSLMAASKVTYSIFALIVVAMFMNVLLSKQLSIRRKIRCVLSFTCPVVLIVGTMLIFNLLRFNSLFEFGTSYQITVSNLSYNKISLYSVFPALFHYFLQPPQFSGTFPFISPQLISLNIYTKFIYNAASFGSLIFPALWWSFALKPAIKRKSSVKSLTLITMTLIVIPLAVINFSLGGINIRYVADILIVLSLASLLITLIIVEKLKNNKTVINFAMLAFLISIAISVAFCFSTEPNNILKKAPILYYKFVQLFVL